MSPVISVKFDHNDHRVYFSGKTLHGKVEVSCSRPKVVQSISIHIIGYGKCVWDNSLRMTCMKRNRSTVNDHAGREEYLSKHCYLLGSSSGNPTELSAGVHKYDFSFELPSTLPSSFEGSHGYIRYLAKISLDRPEGNVQTHIEQFTVMNSFDLNGDSPVLKLRAEVEMSRDFGCFCCFSKTFILKASIPHTGLVAGQIIPVRTEISNASNVPVLDVRFFLRKIISYNSNKPNDKSIKQEIVDLVSVSSGYMVRKGCNKFEEYLAVPKTQTTTRDPISTIIQVEYDIKVEAVVSCWHKNPFILCPVTIGTTVLKNIVENEEASPENENNGDLKALNGKAFTGESEEDGFLEFIHK